jgi:hypothetical protein
MVEIRTADSRVFLGTPKDRYTIKCLLYVSHRNEFMHKFPTLIEYFRQTPGARPPDTCPANFARVSTFRVLLLLLVCRILPVTTPSRLKQPRVGLQIPSIEQQP